MVNAIHATANVQRHILLLHGRPLPTGVRQRLDFSSAYIKGQIVIKLNLAERSFFGSHHPRGLAVDVVFLTQITKAQRLVDRQTPPPIWRWRRRFGRKCLKINDLWTAKSHRQVHRQLAVDLASELAVAVEFLPQNMHR
jgi:hypothetical protein